MKKLQNMNLIKIPKLMHLLNISKHMLDLVIFESPHSDIYFGNN